LKHLTCLSLAALSIACAHTATTRPAAADARPVEAVLPPAPALSPEVAAFFGRANAPDTVASMVVDFDEQRAHGLLGPSDAAHSPYLDLIVTALNAGASALKAGDGALLARAAVLLTLLRDWEGLPHVQRAALLLPYLKEENPAESLSMVLAVSGDAAANATFLKGLAAADRATGEPLLEMRDAKLCYSPGGGLEARFGALCVMPGAGYLLVASSKAIDELAKPGTAAAPLPPPALLRIHANVPAVGSGDGVIEWKAGLRYAANVHPAQAALATTSEAKLNDGLKVLDDQQLQIRSQVTPVMDAIKKGLAADQDAPAMLKQLAASLVIENVVDPKGDYKALRESLQIKRTGSDVAVEAAVPEEAVRRSLKQSTGLIMIAAVGMMAALAVPNFLKYQGRSKQAEVKANLKNFYTAQKAFFQEKDRYGQTFAEIGFDPERGTRYTYCMADKCLPCTAAGCFMPPPEENPCLPLIRAASRNAAGKVFACAFADLKGAGNMDTLDVWTIDESGVPLNVSSHPY
jgi:hypothetical protein